VKEYVLVVDDEQSLRQVLELFFRKEGFEVDTAASLAEAEKAIEAKAYDLVLTDLRMGKPDDGLNVLRAAVRKNPWTQVVVLTAYGTVETAKEAMKLGADDYLVKPFDVAELKARLRALLRRSFNRPEPVLEYRGILLDPVNQQVSYQGASVNLPRKEFVLLHELLAQPGRVLTRDRLQQALYGWDEEVESNALEVHIHHLRRKFFPELIRTVRGVGYLVDKC